MSKGNFNVTIIIFQYIGFLSPKSYQINPYDFFYQHWPFKIVQEL